MSNSSSSSSTPSRSRKRKEIDNQDTSEEAAAKYARAKETLNHIHRSEFDEKVDYDGADMSDDDEDDLISVPAYDRNEKISEYADRIAEYTYPALVAELNATATFFGKHTFPDAESLASAQHPETKAFECLQRTFPGPLAFGSNDTRREMQYHSVRLMKLFIALNKFSRFKSTEENDITREFFTTAQSLAVLQRLRDHLNTWVMTVDPTYKPQFYISRAFDYLKIGTSYNMNSMSSFQQALTYILHKCALLGLRHRDDEVYAPMKSHQGRRLPVYEKLMSIPDFIRSQMESSFNGLTSLLTDRPSNVKDIIATLETSKFQEFPMLKVSRDYFAFRNGIYHTAEDQFWVYGQEPTDVVACKYHDVDMPWDEIADMRGEWDDEDAGFRKIDTPLHQVLKTQFPTAEETKIIENVFVFIGRLLYFQNTKEKWHKVLCILGAAGTGKSTIQNFMASLYEADATSNISNNSEITFGLRSHYESMIVFIEEISRAMKLPKDDFLSMGANGRIEIKTKYAKKSQTVRWNAPLFVVGQNFAAWENSSGELSRRLIVVYFQNTPDIDGEFYAWLILYISLSLCVVCRPFSLFVVVVHNLIGGSSCFSAF